MVRAAVSGRTESLRYPSGNNVTNDGVQPIIDELRPELVLANAGDVINRSRLTVDVALSKCKPNGVLVGRKRNVGRFRTSITAVEAGEKRLVVWLKYHVSF